MVALTSYPYSKSRPECSLKPIFSSSQFNTIQLGLGWLLCFLAPGYGVSPRLTHRMYAGGIRVWNIMFQPYHRGFIETDPTGYALKMSTVYIMNPHEVPRTISLCLVDFGLFL